MLSALYDGLRAQVVDDYRSTKEMGHLLHHVSTQERIMLLGMALIKDSFSARMTARTNSDSKYSIRTLIICASMEATL